MEKFALGLIASLVLLSGVAGAVYMNHRSGEVLRSCEVLAGEVADLKEELQSAREEIQALAEGVQRGSAARSAAPEAIAEPRQAESAPDGPAAVASLASVPHEEIKSFVAVALDEERKQREEERKKQREEFRQRLEARRKEEETLREGPYDRYNLKINSLAKALSLNDAQKQAYFELSKQTQEKFQEERRKLAQAGAAQAAPGTPEAGRGPKGREDRAAVRQLSEAMQKEFSAAVQGMLTAPQVEVYGQLSAGARSFQSMAQVRAPGEQDGPPGSELPTGFRGGAGGGTRNQGPRGR